MANDLQQAQEMYQDALDATREQRQQIEEELRFSDPSNPQQWDEMVKRSRENGLQWTLIGLYKQKSRALRVSDAG